MTDRPLLMSGPMVRAVLDGTKTQTRRVLKPQPDESLPIGGAEFVQMGDDPGVWCWLNGFDGSIVSPIGGFHYAAGDRLWVRENFQYIESSTTRERQPGRVLFSADMRANNGDRWSANPSEVSWRPSIHMPRWASRLTLVVTDVSVERVQDITDKDALAEGVECAVAPVAGRDIDIDGEYWPNGPRMMFRQLWNTLNEDRGYGWDQNPWVVAITFATHRLNIDEMRG